jgi:hypothetical protein
LKEKFDVPCVHCKRGVDDQQRYVHGRVDRARRKTSPFEKKAERLLSEEPKEKEK